MISTEGDFIFITARNPASVCCEAALLVCGLRTLGVAPHPLLPLRITIEEIAGETVELWQWVLAPASADGTPTGDLVKRWNSPEWLALNPGSELATVRTTLLNMGVMAAEARETDPRAVVREGALSAHIPLSFTPAHRQWMLAKLAGTVPLNEVWREPVPATAALA